MIIDISKYPNLIFGTKNNESETVSAFSRKFNSCVPDFRFSTGVLIRFKTDSACVKARYCLDKKTVLPHIGATMFNGLFCAVYNDNMEKIIARGCYLTRMSEEWVVLNNQKHCDRKCFEIYLPAFNELKSLYIEIDDGKEICPIEKQYDFNMVFLGGPMTMGSGCLFAAANYPHTVARRFNAQVFNLAINKNDYLDLQILKNVQDLNADVIFLETFGVWTTLEHLQSNFYNYLEQLLISCLYTPIVLISQPYLGDNLFFQKEAIIKNAIKDLNNKYPNRLFYLSGKKCFEKISTDKISYSTNIINDYGHKVIAYKIIDLVETFLVK